MPSNKFGKFFGGSHLLKKNQPQGVNSDDILLGVRNEKKSKNGYFKNLVGIGGEEKYIREIAENTMYRVIYFSNHADIFYKFTEMSEEEFRSHIADIKSEVEEIVKYCSLKEINKIKMLNDWLVELEKLLDEHLLRPLDQQCQEMYSLLLRHANKSQSFNASSPEEFRAFLQEMRESHRVAKSQITAYRSGGADIRVKDRAITTLIKVKNLLKPLKMALNKHLSNIRESANKMQKEFDHIYQKLMINIEQLSTFIDEEPGNFQKKLEKMKDGCIVANSQIEKYLLGIDNNRENRYKAFKMLKRNLIDIKEIEESMLSIFDTKSHADKTAIEIQKIYRWLFKYAEQSQYFANQEPKEFKENLKRIRNEHQHAYSCIEKNFSGKDRDKENYVQALQKLEKSFAEIKEIEGQLDTFLLKNVNDTISQTYNKLLKHVNQYPHFTSLQRQNFINDLKDIDRRCEQAKSAIETYITETDVSEKKSEAFGVLAEIERELNLALLNEMNAEIMQRCNRLNKYQQSMATEERERGHFKDRLESIENLRRDANVKLEPYVSGNDISEEDKCVAFETLEQCLEKTKVVEIDMSPFLKVPMIEKIDQGYVKLVQGENKSPIFTKEELQELNQIVADSKEYLLLDNNNDPDADKTYELFKEDFDKLSKLEKRISLYLRLRVLRNNHFKIFSSIEKYLNNTKKFDSERKKKIIKLMEQNILNTNSKFEKVKATLKEDNDLMRIEYLGELSLNEYHKSIEILSKQASQLLGSDIRF